MASRKPFVRWVLAAAVLLMFILAIVLIERSAALDALSTWGLRAGLLVLGLILAGAILWYLRPPNAEPVLDTGDDVLLAIAAARARLPRGAFFNRAMVLVLGPEGGAKTTMIARSGGDPELLAGDAPAATTDAPTPTKTANVWALSQAVITELGGALLTDARRWSKVVRALRAPRVAAAVGQGDAAARAIVLCVPCDLFYAGGNGQQLELLAQSLRQRLAQASRELGLAVPVYVMFTKMDRLPHFQPWISVFTKDELRAPLGATLPFDPASNSGSYAERLTPRLDVAFREIIEGIALRRSELLGRESAIDRRYSSYELPRELRKLQPSVTSLLLEVCRPTQIGSSPQLRGFYFMGARPVVVTDVAPASPRALVAAVPLATDATGIFRQPAVAAASPLVAAIPTARKVPEWVFLDRFLRDVVLADPSAASVARGGVGVQRTRRAMLGAVTAAALLLLTGVTVSWLGNRAISNRVAEAARAVSALPVVQSAPGTIALPSPDALRRLDALRAQLDTLRGLIQDGPPWRLRFGLWSGPTVYDAARPVWYDGFRKQLFADGQGALIDSLKALPDAPSPGDDYGTTYARLKGYLITTSSPDKSTSAFLAPVLLTSWQRGITTDADVTGLARRQFEFYASELPTYNPWPNAANASLVTQAREFLSRFTGGDQIYANMLSEANKSVPPVKVPQSPGTVVAPPEVAGAFSANGAKFMVDAFRNSDRYFQGETWVVGDSTAAKSVDRDAIIAAIRTRYHDDYLRSWRQVVQGTNVARASNVKDAAAKLDVIAGMQSPLLQLLRTVAVHTDTDSSTRAAFQPVHAVTPPAIVDKYVSEKNQPYMDGLLGLQGMLTQIGNLPSATDTTSTLVLVQAAQLAGGDVTKARVAAKRVSQGFAVSAEASSMASAVEQLLLAPIVGAEAVLRTVASARPPAKRMVAVAPPPPVGGGGGGGGGGVAAAEIAALNERGVALCSKVDASLTSKFPFNADATADATIADVKAILTPDTGELWTFYADRLAKYLTKSGLKYVAKLVDGVELSESFVGFFNKAAEVSDALFAEDPANPHVTWNVSGMITETTPLVILKNNGLEARLDKQSFKNVVEWPATSGRQAELLARFKKNKELRVKLTTGEWAIFRLVASGDAFQGSLVTWNAAGLKDAEPVRLRFDAQQREAASVLTRGWMGRMSCVARVTK
ncbi:ImcF-related family protein [Gemmatimonas sp.]|uniref:ImcF-related family protein n=1 Tax=Gemmatimonas sp. TaxID=1962908 RepID=UPI00356388D4